MHFIINALDNVPCVVRSNSTATHDHTFLKELNLEKCSFVVIDKAHNVLPSILAMVVLSILFAIQSNSFYLFVTVQTYY